MKNTITLILAAAVAFGTASFAKEETKTKPAEAKVVAKGEPTWETDFAAAQARAKKEGKPMLVDFTGSDWCGWCIKLKKEVFSKKEFKEYAAKNLVLVELDFPRRTEISAELKKQNTDLAKKYGVRGFPTILLFDSKGTKIGKTGYKKGGPEPYVVHLKEMLKKKG